MEARAMSGAGRPQRPLDTDGGPLQRLAGELRRLRGTRKYRELAAETGLSVATLQTAAAGKDLPSWPVTRAFTAACGGGEGAVRELWEDACAAAGRHIPDHDPPPEPPVPGPDTVTDAAQFVEMMKRLRMWAGNPSLAELNKRAGGHNLLPPSTVSEMLRRQRLPRLDLVLTYVRACDLNDVQIAAWEQAWARLRARELMQGQPLPASLPQEHPSRADRMRARRRASRVAVRDLLVWMAGARPEVLKRSPSDRSSYIALGTAVLVTFVFATISMTFALHVAVLTPLPPAVGIGLAWGALVVSLDRFLVTSIHRGPLYKILFTLAPRLILALLIGSVISTPVVLGIFAPDISAQIVIDRQEQAAQFASTMATGSLGRQIEALQAEFSQEQAQASSAYRDWQCQLYGGPGCPPAVNGPLAEAAKQQYETVTSAAAHTTAELNALRSQEQHLQEDFNTTSQHPAGLLTRLEALAQIGNQNATVTAGRFLLFLLVIVIDCMPIIVRTMQVMGPQNTYEKILRMQELADIRLASEHVGTPSKTHRPDPAVPGPDLRRPKRDR